MFATHSPTSVGLLRSPRGLRPRRSLLIAAAVVGVVGMLGAAGCTQSTTEEQVSMGGSFAGSNTPLVISTRPEIDTAAYNASERQLGQAHWETQREISPKPKWETLPTPRGKALQEAEEGARQAQPADFATGEPLTQVVGAEEAELRAETPFVMAPAKNTPAQNTPAAQPAVQADPKLKIADAGARAGAGAASAQATPSAQESAPADASREYVAQYGVDAAIDAVFALDELPKATASQPLPVTVDPAGDGNIRLIWSLRHFGGPGVSSKLNGGTSRRDVSLQNNDLAPLIGVINQHLGGKGTALPLPSENSVVVVCPEAQEEAVIQLLDRLDRAQPQVEIAAKIFEVSHDFDYQQGARLLLSRLAEDGAQTALSSFNTQSVLDAMSKGTPLQGSVVSLMQTFQDAGLSVEASFQFLADAGMIQVVSSPRLTVAEGQTGYMLAGQELPIQSASYQGDVLKTTTEYKPVGVQLYITPQAVGGNQVKLHTVSIVSSVSGFVPLPDVFGRGKTQALLVNPIIESREAETAVTVEDGNTLVISGMRMIRTTTREEKVPGLGDIPLLGNLFKNHRSQQRMTDLYFFITPTLAYMDE